MRRPLDLRDVDAFLHHFPQRHAFEFEFAGRQAGFGKGEELIAETREFFGDCVYLLPENGAYGTQGDSGGLTAAVIDGKRVQLAGALGEALLERLRAAA